MSKRFLFVNKTQKSDTLSRSRKSETANILSHSQTRRRLAEKKRPPAAQPWEQQSSVLDMRGASSSPSTSSDEKRERGSPGASEMVAHLAGTYPDFNASDPFHCTVARADAGNHAFLRLAFSSATRPVFLAEAFAPPSVRAARKTMRHDSILNARLRRCVEDEMVMYSTLTYGSCLMSWLLSRKITEPDSRRLLNKSLGAMRLRLPQHSERADNWLVLSIYSLAVTELWKGSPMMRQAGSASPSAPEDVLDEHLFACKTHLKAALHLVQTSGGWTQFDPYVLDSLLLVDKYLGFTAGRPLMLTPDWDPGPMTQQLQELIGLRGDTFPRLGTGLVDLPVAGKLKSALQDLTNYCQAAYAAWNNAELGLDLETWLFRRIQAITYRVHGYFWETEDHLEKVICLTSLIFIHNCMEDKGPSISVVYLARRLKALIQASQLQHMQDSGLLQWCFVIGALMREDFPERAWFVKKFKQSLDEQTTKRSLQAELETYLYLDGHAKGGLDRLMGI